MSAKDLAFVVIVVLGSIATAMGMARMLIELNSCSTVNLKMVK